VARKHAADLGVAIGGGSVLDVGKAVAMLLGNGGDPLDYLEIVGRGKPITKPSVPYVAVPTTAGTGAEVTENAVLASPADGRKASLRSRFMLPTVALVDPLLTLGCPPAVTASSGLDALTQCLEPLVSVRATPLIDGLAREGLRRAAAGLRPAYRDDSDVAARTDMSVCSLLGGLALANAKLGAVHGFAAVIGGMTTAAHGAICAALLAAVVEANVRALRAREPAHPALDRFDQAARLLSGRADATVEDGIDWINETVSLLHVPSLAALGVRSEDVTDIVTRARTASSMKFNPIAMTDDELHDPRPVDAALSQGLMALSIEPVWPGLTLDGDHYLAALANHTGPRRICMWSPRPVQLGNAGRPVRAPVVDRVDFGRAEVFTQSFGAFPEILV
jgi:alcohol dehydrogenase class IV